MLPILKMRNYWT